MADIAKNILSFLLSFFGLAEGETSSAFVLVCKVFRQNGNLRLATDKEDTRITSPHTATSHNADTTTYIPVRDKRAPEVPLVLKPVDSKKTTVAYVVVLDTDKVSTEAHCKSFAELYMAKTLKGKKTFEALAASLFARQSGEDIVNNTRQKEARKFADRAKLVSLAQPFLSLAAEVWSSVRPSIESSCEELAEVIDELRTEAESSNQ